MSDEIIEFNIPADADGYVTFQCSFCDNTFKLHVDECQDDDLMEFFCPYCGLVDEPSEFLNDEIIQLVIDKAENLMIDIMNNFTSDLERSFRGNSMVQVKSSKIDKKGEKEVFEADSEEIITTLSCCGKYLKIPYSAKESGIICPYCGVR